MPAAQKIIIDTDPGQDDAVAILLALASPELDVLGITAVAGNVPLKLTEKNARKVCELAGKPEIKVFAGAIRPLVRPLVTAEYVHGKTGLDGPDLPEPKMPLQKEHAVDFIVETLMKEENGAVTLCALGPLTNVALALIREPRISKRIKQIVLMGGGFFEGGNTTPTAEFNIYVDPHAADAVFRAGVPIVMMPLEATHQAILTRDWAEQMQALGTRTGKAVAGMFLTDLERPRERHGGRGVPLHDPCVIAYLLWPELFTGQRCHVAIETESRLTRGRTVVDRWGVTGAPPNALVIDRVDAPALFARMQALLATLP
jgi:purine nucleosidase